MYNAESAKGAPTKVGYPRLPYLAKLNHTAPAHAAANASVNRGTSQNGNR